MSQNEFIEIPANKRSLARRKLVYGCGVNNADYMISYKSDDLKTIKCPYYRAWNNMFGRCYGDLTITKQKTYLDCSVTNEWFEFMNFRSWMKLQDWRGMHLDKDIKVIGNKIYSPKTCLFVTSAINNLIIDSASIRGEFPIGVSFDAHANKFQTHCRHDGKQSKLGYFDTVEEASLAYNLCKKKIIEEAACRDENKYIKEYLLAHADAIGHL